LKLQFHDLTGLQARKNCANRTFVKQFLSESSMQFVLKSIGAKARYHKSRLLQL